MINSRAFKWVFQSLASIFFLSITSVLFAQLSVNIAKPFDTGTVGGKAKVEFTITNAGAGLTWRAVIDKNTPSSQQVNAGTTASDTFFWDTTGLSDSIHTLTLYAKDTSNPVEISTTVNVTVDNTNFIVLTAPLEGAVVKGTVTVTGKAAGSWDLKLDDTVGLTTDNAASAISFEWSTDPVSQGTHTLSLIVRDTLGSESRIVRTVKIDRTVPTVTINTPANNGFVKASNVSVTATVNDANPNTWEAKVDGGTTGLSVSTGSGGSISINWNAASFSNGKHTISISATDKAGNVGSASTVDVTVDSILPTVTLTTPVNNAQISNSPLAITGTVSDTNLQGWNLTIDGGSTGFTPSFFTVSDSSTTVAVSATLDPSLLSEGAHTLALIGSDKSGNTLQKSVVLLKDATSPVVTLTNPDENKTDVKFFGTQTITASIQDTSDVTWIVKIGEVQLGSGTTKSISVNWNTAQKNLDSSSKYPDGTHTVTIIATDTAGNSSTTKSKQVTVNNTPPVLEVTTPTDKSYVKGVVQISGTVNDALATWVVRVDGQQIDSGTGSIIDTAWDATNTSSGLHSVVVTATNEVGNSATKTISVRVDNDKPTVKVSYPFNNMKIRPGTKLTVLIDVTDSFFNTSDATQNSVLATGVTAVIKDDKGVQVASITSLKEIVAQSGTIGRWFGTVNITVPKPFRALKAYAIEVTATDKSGNTSVKVTSKFIVKFF
ncbi:MAG: Ig-like domain-containing protein [bacterium]